MLAYQNVYQPDSKKKTYIRKKNLTSFACDVLQYLCREVKGQDHQRICSGFLFHYPTRRLRWLGHVYRNSEYYHSNPGNPIPQGTGLGWGTFVFGFVISQNGGRCCLCI